MTKFTKPLLAAAVLVLAPSLAWATSVNQAPCAHGQTIAAMHSYHAARLARL